jgi:hypothetical protein
MCTTRALQLGRVVENNRYWELTEDQLARHVFIGGTTGGGKSKLLELIAREHIEQGMGLLCIDPDGDLTDSILAYLAKKFVETNDRRLLSAIHYWEPSPFQLFRMDLGRFSVPFEIPRDFAESARTAWQYAQNDRLSQIIQGKTGMADFEGQPRAQRVIGNVFHGVLIEVRGKRLAPCDGAILINIFDKRHHEIFAKVAPKLPNHVIADIEYLHSIKRMEDYRRETESTTNRFHTYLAGVLGQIISGTGAEPAIDPYAIIQRSGIVLVNLRETFFFSHDQAVTLGRLVLNLFMQALWNTPRHLRKPFTLEIDEVGEFTGEELARWLKRSRKYMARFVLAGQDLSTFRKKDIDIIAPVLAMCNTVMTFTQAWPDDVEILAKIIGGADYDFTPLVHEVERHVGHDWVTKVEVSRSKQKQQGWSSMDGTNLTDAETTQDSTTHSQHRSASSARSQPESGGRVTITKQTGMADGAAAVHARGTAKARGTQHQDGASGSETDGITVSERAIPLPHIVREKQKTGDLEEKLEVQEAKKQVRIRRLKTRQAWVKAMDQDEPFEIRTLDVADPFLSETAMARAVDAMKRLLFETHPYFFTPSFDPEDQRKRLQKFLDEDHEQRNGSPASEGLRPTTEKSPLL